MTTILTDERINERAEILYAVDAQVCQWCGRSALDVHAADDPAWFIDSVLAPNPACPSEPVVLAEIFCPACW